MADLRYIEAFREAARTLNFSRAADALKISPSALGRQIRLLEESVGAELFIRTTRSVSLTSTGRKLFEASEAFADRLKDLDGRTGVRIGCLQSIFDFKLSELIARHPKAFGGRLDIVIAGPRRLRQSLAAGELDIILTHIRPAGDSGVSSFRLYRETLGWVGPEKEDARPIILSAFEEAYPKSALSSPDRIHINSFSGAMAIARKNIGRALVALPSREASQIEKTAHHQWIYVVSPNFRNPPRSLKAVLSVLRDLANT